MIESFVSRLLSDGGEPREYDRLWHTNAPGPTRVTLAYDRDDATRTMTRFVVQLEYSLEGDWYEIVRFDHDTKGGDKATHNVTTEGVHMDVYRDGEKVDTVEIFPPMPATEAFTYAENHIAEHAE